MPAPPPPADLLAKLHRYDPSIQRLLLRAREFVWRHARPTTEKIYALKYTVAVWCGGDGGMNERPVYVAAFRSHVNIGFLHGADLPDPARILKGTGRHMRHVQITSAAGLDSAQLAALVKAAGAIRSSKARRRRTTSRHVALHVR